MKKPPTPFERGYADGMEDARRHVRQSTHTMPLEYAEGYHQAHFDARKKRKELQP